MNKQDDILFFRVNRITKFILVLIYCSSTVLSQEDYLKQAGEIDDPLQRILFLNTKSDIVKQQDPSVSKKLSTEALRLSEEINNDTLIYSSRFGKGVANYMLANQNEALEDFIKNKELAKKLRDNARIVASDNAIANAYKDIGRHDLALSTYKEALSLSSRSNKQTVLILANIGILYNAMGNYDSSNYYCYKVLGTYRNIPEKQKQFVSNTLGTLLINYTALNQSDSVQKYLKATLDLKKEINDLIGYAGTLYNLADYYREQAKYAQAEEYLREAIKMKPNNIELEYDIKKLMAIVLYMQKKYEESASYYSDAIYLKDSLSKIQTIDRLSELEVKYETNKKEEELKRLALLNEMDDLKLKQSRNWLIVSVGGILFGFIVVGLLYRQNKNRRKANKLLETQNHEILLQKKEITDSINYAKRIQLAIQPPDDMVKRLLPTSFIFYKPKDLVSGDFYWLEERNGLVMFAAVDCTGHGVPGAMMSVVGLNLLNQAVNEKGLTVPSEILQHLDKGVTETLRQTAAADTVKDGMDLSLCTLDPKTKTLQFSGAFNNLCLVRKDIATSYKASSPNEVFFEKDLLEIKADKFPIGSNLDGVADNYTNYTLQLQEDDCVYLYSDGFADQFGGPKGKKFKYNALKKLLVTIHHLDPSEQKEILSRVFNQWRGNLEQVDDILVIGVKIS
jgi:serine phosphatase RsbU (regulator of sigma subunit)/Tfp pilus assembly protein PilF